MSGAAKFNWLQAVNEAIAAESRKPRAARKSRPDEERQRIVKPLTSLDMQVAVALSRWVDKDLTGWRSQRNIAADCGVTEAAARASVARLRSAGLLEIASQPMASAAARGRPATGYRAVLPENYRNCGCGKPEGNTASVDAENGRISVSTDMHNRGISATTDTVFSATTDTPYSLRDSERNRERGESPPSPPRRQDDDSASAAFEAFFASYPKKVAKRRARRAFDAALRDGADPSEVIEGAKRYAAMCAAERREARYIAAPANFLADERWQEKHQPITGRAQGGQREDPMARAARLYEAAEGGAR